MPLEEAITKTLRAILWERQTGLDTEKTDFA